MTLVEVVVVAVIIAILAAVAVPHYASAVSNQRVAAAAVRIVADLALARREAERTSTSRRVSFDLAANSYSLPGVADLDRPGSDYEVRLGDEPYRGAIISADFGGDTDLIYDGYGRPDSGGSVVIAVGRRKQAVNVNGDTGVPTVDAAR